MADDSTPFSCALDAGTPEHAARALDPTTGEFVAGTYKDVCLAAVLGGGAPNA